MSIVLGIDVGGSTTKVVGLRQDTLVGVLQVRAADQLTSMFGAVGNFLHKYKIPLEGVSSVVLTGVGASFFTEKVFGIETHKADEFQAIGRGGLHLAEMDEAFVASLGTGTAFVRATKSEVTHIGGSGVGGGTLLGLASKMTNKNDVESIMALAESGKLENVDLSVREIIGRDIPSLPPNLTASNFGKIKSTATDADFALGIINMVFQTIGMLAVFAVRNDAIKDVILTGTLTTLPQVQDMMKAIHDSCGVNFIIPPNAVFATAIGAAMPYIK